MLALILNLLNFHAMQNNVISFDPVITINGKAHRKESGFYKSLSLVHIKPDGQIYEAAVIRFYATRANNFACFWLHLWPTFASGSASANGGGYHKESAAAHYALKNAGVELEHSIDGVGSEAVEGALMALAAHLKLQSAAIIEAHA